MIRYPQVEEDYCRLFIGPNSVGGQADRIVGQWSRKAQDTNRLPWVAGKGGIH